MSIQFLNQCLEQTQGLKNSETGNILAQRAAVLYAMGNFADVYVDLKACLKLNGLDLNDLERIADLLLKLGKFEDVRSVLENIFSYSSIRKSIFLKQFNESVVSLHRANQHLQNYSYHLAITDAEKGLLISPQSADLILFKCECLVFTGKPEGRSWFSKIVFSLLSPDLHQRYEQLKSILDSNDGSGISQVQCIILMNKMRDKARQAWENGDYTNSEYFFKTAIALAKDKPRIQVELREECVGLMLQYNKLEQAHQQMYILQQLNPSQYKYWEKSGDVLMKLSKFLLAVEQFKRAYEMCGDGSVLRKLEAAQAAARPNYYQILGVSTSASVQEIRAKYIHLAKVQTFLKKKIVFYVVGMGTKLTSIFNMIMLRLNSILPLLLFVFSLQCNLYFVLSNYIIY